VPCRAAKRQYLQLKVIPKLNCLVYDRLDKCKMAIYCLLDRIDDSKCQYLAGSVHASCGDCDGEGNEAALGTTTVGMWLLKEASRDLLRCATVTLNPGGVYSLNTV
jgi:hypothetical protein